jgi:hypothetical protein
MSTRRALRGALHNFLGTFTSRYTDCDGYWLLGLIEEDLEGLRIDLLSYSEDLSTGAALAFAAKHAREKFREQLRKAGVSPSWVSEAHLKISRSPEPIVRFFNCSFRTDHKYSFSASVLTDLTRTFEAELVVDVAPHDSVFDFRFLHESSGISPNFSAGLLFRATEILCSI